MYQKFFKRMIDFLLSLIALVILSPLMLVLIIIGAVQMGGNPFFTQPRPGKNEKIFKLIKFRSMTNKKDENGNLLPDSQRITWFGKFLRKTSLDELPQLFNILKGDMSIIGPRPRLVKDMLFYDEEIYPYYISRPGLTGPTQAFGRNKNTWEDVFAKDIEYVKKITFLLDLKILFCTFFSVFKDTGESHSNTEEEKDSNTKNQEYYYPDYVLRIGKITKQQYDLGLKIANEIIKEKKYIDYYPELHNQSTDNESSQINLVEEQNIENDSNNSNNSNNDSNQKIENN